MALLSEILPVLILTSLLGCQARRQDPEDISEQINEQKITEEDLTGPKAMGYQYLLRSGISLLRGTYSDEQTNEATGRGSKLENVNVPGKMISVEHYPVVWEEFPTSEYAYTLIEFISDKPDYDGWEARSIGKIMVGYILPMKRLIAPVVGIYWEFNKLVQGEKNTPEVVKSDVRATIVGVNFRRKIWGTGSIFAVYYAGKFHMLNLTLPNNGMEYEFVLGMSVQYSIFRGDIEVGYMAQTFDAKKQDPEQEDSMLKLKSNYKATMLRIYFWI